VEADIRELVSPSPTRPLAASTPDAVTEDW